MYIFNNNRRKSHADADGAAAWLAPMPPPGKGEARLAEAPPPLRD